MRMKKAEVYIIANGSSIRAFQRRVDDAIVEEEVFELEEIALDPAIMPPPKSDAVATDRPGRFESGDRAGHGNNLVHGERHGVTLEWEKRQGQALADSIEKIVTQQNRQPWSLLAPSKWLPRIEACLSASASKQLVSSDAVDLSQHTIKDIEIRLAPK